MIGYALFGSNDLPRSFAFYDALFASVGINRLMEFPTGAVCWGTSWTAPMLGVGPAYDGQPATAGNGTMIALVLDTRAKVDAMHAAALAAALATLREQDAEREKTKEQAKAAKA